jgi:hypothetical protein
VNDLVMNIHGAAVRFERQVDDIHSSHHSGTKSPGAHSYQRLSAVIRALDVCKRQCVLRNMHILPEIRLNWGALSYFSGSTV